MAQASFVQISGHLILHNRKSDDFLSKYNKFHQYLLPKNIISIDDFESPPNPNILKSADEYKHPTKKTQFSFISKRSMPNNSRNTSSFTQFPCTVMKYFWPTIYRSQWKNLPHSTDLCVFFGFRSSATLTLIGVPCVILFAEVTSKRLDSSPSSVIRLIINCNLFSLHQNRVLADGELQFRLNHSSIFCSIW